MGPPRRARSNSSVSNYSQQHRNRHPQSLEPTPPESIPPAQSHLGMSPQSRYLSNMKVVRRRDPSIVSIFDQFSHVCVYHHNGGKWEKQGYEGSMFLYERDSYPPYGLYILNRAGMDDYIQRLHPEDGISAHGSYLMIRQYPDFTTRRLAEARAKLPLSKQEGPASKFAPEFVVPDLERLQDAEKGRSQTVGLWCLATDARESMQDVVLRLHSHIKKNIAYPDEYRYGPDHPPPNFRSSSRVSERSHVRSASSASNTSSMHGISESEEEHLGSKPTPSNSIHSNGNISELDKLFAKLGGTSSTPQQISPQSQTMEATTASLMASLCAGENAHRTTSVPLSSTTSVPPTRGLALLDTIFASAPLPTQPNRGPSRTGAASTSIPACTSIYTESTYNTRTQSTTYGHSSISQNPHILSPKPTSTALPQVLNQEVISTLLGLPASRAYEGDNEASDDGSISEGGHSVSSTILDTDSEHNVELQAVDSSSGLPLLAVPMGGADFNSTRNGNGRILGDVTPRPPLRGFSSDITVVGDLLAAAQTHKHLRASPQLHIPSAAPPPADPNTTPTMASVNDTHSAPKPRPLIPFEADSELWPYPRAPFIEADSDVIELDFADTSALSDPDAFAKQEQRAKNRRSQKKGRKEREKDREREREEIEKSWDVPQPAQASLPPPQEIVSTPPVTVNGKGKHGRKERAGSLVSQSSGDGPSAIDSRAAYTSLLSALAQKKNASLKDLSRNDFVREVLTLIHTDKEFVDSLWLEYTSSEN